MAKIIMLSYTDSLYDILDEIRNDVSERLIKLESDPSIDNSLGIEMVDKSIQDWSFDIKINGKWRPMKVGTFIRNFLGAAFTDKQINEFTAKYNRVKRGLSIEAKQVIKSVKVEVPKFVWNPKDVRSTFISLTTETYPHGHEEEVLPFIRNIGLKRDQFGNYYKIIGVSKTMFTSHLDTADRKKSKVNLYSEKEKSDEIFITDGTTILGADDKAGMAVMLYMMAHNIPGIYYFFVGEERGGIGSGQLSSVFESTPHLKGVQRCVSFDRRNYFSIITSQMGVECCSDEFAQALSVQYNKAGMKFNLDPTGIYTDSASFIDQIPECTNISVGYFNEHTTKERQNITFLESLAKASVRVKWEELPTVKKVGLDEEILAKYGKFITEFKACPFNMSSKIVGERGKAFVKMEMDIPDVDLVQEDLLNMATLFNKHKMDPDIVFEDDVMKFQLVKDLPRFSVDGSAIKNNIWNKYLDSYSSFLETSFVEEEYEGEEEFVGGESINDEISELCYWIQQMFKSSGATSTVESDEYDILSYVFLNRREKIGNLLNIFDVVGKIMKDILSHYGSEVELYQNKQGGAILRFTFTWNNQEESEDNINIDDEDNGPF